jgi:membrane-associated phospholipid phosphatase
MTKLKIMQPFMWLLLSFTLISTTTIAQNWDIDLLKKINPSQPTSSYWKVASSSVYWVPATGLLATFLVGTINHDKQLQKQTYKALISIAVSTTVSEILKVSINKTRPSYAYPNDIFQSGGKGQRGKSFPSGHATLAFTYATTLSLQYKKWYVVVPAYLWAGSVGYSRMYLGKHYPSDVLVGAALGTLSGWLTYKLTNKLFKQK